MDAGNAIPRVAILAMPETSASVVYGMYDLFKSAGRDWELVTGGAAGPPLLDPVVVATGPGPLALVHGVRISPEATLAEVPCPDVICVPEMYMAPEDLEAGRPLPARFDAPIAWLQRCYRSGSILASACSGALLLAEAGLLREQEATTHWAFCDVLQQREPTVTMRPNSTLVASGEGQRLIMAGGGTSWFDLALYLIARLAGVETAMRTARVNLIDWHAGGQQPFAQLASSRQSADALISECQTWIAQHYEEPAPVAEMVRRSGLAERTFKRRFQKATGMTPLEYVHTLRLEEAKQMLEAGSEPVEAIAEAVGYQDAGFFGRLFKRKTGLTPAQYRRRFGSMRRMLQGGWRDASAEVAAHSSR